MKNKLLLVLLVVSLIVPLVLVGGCKAAGPGETITLKFISFLPNRFPSNAPFVMFTDKVNEKAKGALVIEIAGGPETVAPPDAPGAVQKGSVPIANTLSSLTDRVVPGIRVLSHNELPYKELRKNAQDYIQEMCNKAGIYYLGQAKPVTPQTMLSNYTKKMIRTIDDFKGVKLGTPSPLAVPFYKAIGAIPVVVPLNEYFTALERGVIDGINFSTEDVPANGLHEVLKCAVDHPYCSSPDIFIMNLDLWNSLSKKLQNVLTESAIEVENEFADYYDKEIREPARKQMRDAGMEFVKFPEAEAQKYHELYKSSCWAAEAARNPEIVNKLKSLITK